MFRPIPRRHCGIDQNIPRLTDPPPPCRAMLVNALYIVAALLLVLLNGFFVAAEFALVKLRYTQAVGLAEGRGWRGRVLLGVHGHLDAYLSACQLGITLASLGLGWIGKPAFAHLLEPVLSGVGGLDPETIDFVSFLFAFTVISFLHIVLGELAPKSMAIRRPERMSLWTAVPLYLFYWLMYPAIWLLNTSANWMLRLFGLDKVEGHEHHYSREELKLILHGNRARDSGETFEMLSHALDLPELVAGDLLRTRDELASLHDGQTQDEVLAEVRRSQFSRYPWFEADGDGVRGVLHVKDLLLAVAARGVVEDITALLRPGIVVPLDTPVLDVLKRFRAGSTHLALVNEESGRVVGFFTLQDLVEVIVGDIADAHRRKRPSAIAQPAADGSFTIPGSLPIYRLERLLGHEIEAPDEVNSVGGLIIHRLERLPTEGESFAFDGFTLTVRAMKGAKAQAITVKPDPSTRDHTTALP